MPQSDDVRSAFQDADRFFPTGIQKFQFFDKYSRYSYDVGRRETWIETVDRTVDYLRELSRNQLPDQDYTDIRQAILNMEVMPSMRSLAMAGDAARRSNIAIYNCSAMPVIDFDAFVEALIISMNGCGVGFSVERQFVDQLPVIWQRQGGHADLWVVEDTTEGWADALRYGLGQWAQGIDVVFDYKLVRPAGAVLRVKGGQASGPEPLKTLLDFARSLIFGGAGRKLTPLECHDLMCMVGSAAVSGGVRRTAMISLFDMHDEAMLHCKDGEFPSYRWNANNSAVWNSRLTEDQVDAQLQAMADSGGGEPGIFSRWAAANTSPCDREQTTWLTNPCVTGKTWISVADGRGRVQIKDLAEQGQDVDVYTMKEGEVVIRKMRNPRKTGIDTPVFKVTFSDGTSIRVTANHKFHLTDGTEKQAIDLQSNDSLKSMKVFSYKKRGLPKLNKVNYDEPGSYRMLQAGTFRKSDHRMVYGHNTGVWLNGISSHLHHRDYDGRNNSMENLELVTATEHAAIHRERMLGANNPVHKITNEWRANLSKSVRGELNGWAKKITNEKLKEMLYSFVRELGYCPTTSDYHAFAKSNDLPMVFSEWRHSYFGGSVMQTIQQIALELGVMSRHEAEARSKTDLPVSFRDGKAYVTRQCEICANEFTVSLNRREQATCGHSCSAKLSSRLHGGFEWGQKIKEARIRNHPDLRFNQSKLYNDLLFELGHHPSKKEWQDRCKQKGVSFEISRVSSPFRFWSELKESASSINHRVVSIEPDGFEDVYTGTVDETHTYFGIGTEKVDSKGRVEMGYVLNSQCGEIVLRSFQFCNLTSIVARPDDTIVTLVRKAKLATIIGTIQSMATHFPGLRPEWKANAEAERLLGVSLDGQMDSEMAQDPDYQRYMREICRRTNVQYAKLLGINKSAAITCVKPSGNSSQLLNCSSGIHARWSPYYIRNIRVGAHNPLYKVLRDAGVPMDPENGQSAEDAITWVIHFPVAAPIGSRTRNDRSAIEQCEYWLQVKNNWTDHNPSITVTYKPEELPAIKAWLYKHQAVIGGMAFLPSFDATYDQLPYQECTKAEYETAQAAFPLSIDFGRLVEYESRDNTSAAQEVACMSGLCEI